MNESPLASGEAPQVKEQFTCKICSSTGEHKIFLVPEFQCGTKEIFKYFECSNCGCLQHAEIPADLGRYYPTDYYSLRPVEGVGLKKRIKSILDRKRDRSAFYGKGILGWLLRVTAPGVTSALNKLRRLDLNRDTRILDVGSGSGHFLHFLANEGFRHVTGVEPFIQKTLHYSNGLKILKQNFTELNGEWDVILFNHSFEHIPDNLETLQHAHKLLVNGGWCIIEIPSVSSYAWHHYGIYWHQLDAPRHIFLHSLKSFQILAEKCGFIIRKTHYTSDPSQFWGSENYLRGVKPKAARTPVERISNLIYRSASFIPQYFRTHKLNQAKQGDAIAFYLQKK